MVEEHTTAAVQRYLDELAGDASPEPIIRALLDRAVRRLHQLCDALLYRQRRDVEAKQLELKRSDVDATRQAEEALRALRDARDEPSRRRALEALEGALRSLREQLPDDRREKKDSP
jgi:RNA polymerase sigma-70 factor (ECF subfamily)